MSQTIDSRVVEMKFDNRDFEKNVAESMKTLDNLNKRVEKLENTQVDFGKISKGLDSLNFDKLDKALDSITHRFSVMGQIGASAIQSITQGALNLAKSGISNVWNTTFGQIKSGGMSRSKNIENAKFLLEGTGVAFEKVESSINNAVLDTAFGFDEAAKAAAGLAAAGVQVGNSMDTALLSISGVAAMTNRSYSDIADIFQDAAAAGKASADTFGRLAERGLAAKSIMMDYLKITSSDEFDKLAKKGGITFDKFAQAMYDNFAAQAKKSNETLDGVVANCKAALSRMGQTFYQPLMANNSEVVLMLQTLKKQLNEIKKITDPLAEHMANYVLSLAKYLNGVIGSIDITKLQPISDNAIKIFDNLTKALENIYSNILKPFGKAFKDALYEAFPSLNTGKSLLVTLSDKLVEGSQKIREFTAEIGLFGEKNVALKEILKGIFELLKSFVEIVKNLAVALKPLLTLIGSIAKALVSLIAGLGPVITSALSNLPGIINIGAQIVAGILSGILSGATTVGGAIITLGKIIVSAFTSFFIIHSPSRLMALAVGIPIAAGIAAGLILGKDKIIEAADALGETLRAVMEKAVDTMFIPFEVVGKKFKGPIEKFKDFMHALGNTVIFKPFVELLKILGSALELINLTLRRTITLVANLDEAGFGRLLNQIKGFVVTMVTMFSLNKLSKAFTAFSTGIGGIGKAIQKGLNSISSGIKAYARAQVLGKLGDIFKNLAIAVATITAAILVMGWAIGDPDRWERIQTSLWIIGGIVGALTAIVVAFGILATNLEGFKSKNMAGVATAFVAIAASIWLVAGSLKKVGNMGLPQLITGFIGIIVMFAAVAYAMHKFKSNSNGIVKSDWLLILSFGLTISMIAKSLVKVALVGFFSKETLWNAAGVILSIVGVFGLIAVAMEGLSKLEIGQVGNLGMLKEMPLTFLAMGVAVYAIASAIKKLSKIKQADLDKAYDKILAVMLLIEAVILTAHFVANDISQLLYSMAALVVACGLIIKYIGAIENTDVVDRGMWVLGKLAVGILGFIIGIELITKRIGGGTSDLKTLLYIAALITACGAIIAIVGNMKPQAVIGAMATLLVLGAGILAFIYALDKITRKSTQLTRGDLFNLHKSGKKGIVDKIVQFGEIMAMIRTVVNSIVKLSITMAIVSRVIKNWEDLAKAIIILGAVMVPIVGTILLLDQVDTGGGENIKGIAKVITAMCLAILMISGSLLVLSQMPLSSLWSAGAVMGIIIGMVALLASQLKESKNWKNMGYEFNTKAITGIVFAIAAIGVALTALTMFNQDENGWLRMAAAGVAIGICIAAVGFAVEKMSGFEFDKESAKAVLIASLSLVAVAGAIWIIAQAKWDDYWKGLASAAGCIVVLGIVLVALNKLKIEKDNAWTLVIACGALLVLAGVIAIISQFEWEKYAPGLGLMGLCILAIAAALRIAQGADWKTALTLGIGCLSLLPAAFALSMIADYDWYAILAAAVGMAIAIGAVGAILIGLAALASASGGIGAGLIIAIAGALVIASLSLVAIAGAMLIAAEAAKVFVGIFTPETAQNIL